MSCVMLHFESIGSGTTNDTRYIFHTVRNCQYLYHCLCRVLCQRWLRNLFQDGFNIVIIILHERCILLLLE